MRLYSEPQLKIIVIVMLCAAHTRIKPIDKCPNSILWRLQVGNYTVDKGYWGRVEDIKYRQATYSTAVVNGSSDIGGQVGSHWRLINCVACRLWYKSQYRCVSVRLSIICGHG